jgi:hypothetical protein
MAELVKGRGGGDISFKTFISVLKVDKRYTGIHLFLNLLCVDKLAVLKLNGRKSVDS